MPNPASASIALLGAGGTMGAAMARNLAAAGHQVTVWNRTRERAQPLADDGVAQVVDTPAKAAGDAEIILTMLADADAVVAAVDGPDGALSAARDGAIWLQMSTIGEAGTDRCAELAAERGVQFVDAPVLGTKRPAEQGTLTVLASGPSELSDRLTPIFDAVGQRTMWVGAAGQGSKLKLATNMWLLALVEGLAETYAFAEGLELDPQLLFEAIGGGPLDVPYFQLKGQAIAKRDFEPQFALRMAAKDAGLMVDAAQGRSMDLPLLQTIRRRFDEGAAEHGDQDLSATYLTSSVKR